HDRAVNEAQGYANEVLPKARAQAIEATEGARAYKESRIAEPTGEAQRFRAIACGQQEVTDVLCSRHVVGTTWRVLPSVRTGTVQPGTAVAPLLPLDAQRAKEPAP